MQTEPLLIHPPPGITASKVAFADAAPNVGSGGFDVLFGLEVTQPSGSHEDGSALPSADSPVAWDGVFWPAVPLSSFPAWPVARPSEGAASIDAMPVEDPVKAGFEAWASPEPHLSTGDAAKASPLGEGSIGPIPVGPILVGPIQVGPIQVGTARKPAPTGDDLRDPLTTFPQLDASGEASPPREGGSLAGGPPPESASPMARPLSAAMPVPRVSLDGSGPGASVALVGPMPNRSESDPKAGSSPGPVGMNFGVAPGPVLPAGSVGEAHDPRQNADLASAKVSTLIAHPDPALENTLRSLPEVDARFGQPSEARVHKASAPVPVTGPAHEAAMLVSESGTDPQPVLDPVEGGSDPAAPAKDRATPASLVHVTGAERLWLGAQHMRAVPIAEPAGTTGAVGLSGNVTKDASVAAPDREAIVPAFAGTGAAAAPQPVSSLAVLAFRQAEDPLVSAESGLGIADRFSLPPPTLAAFPLLPAAPVLQVAAQITASLTQRPDGTTEIALSPEELGSVRLQFQADAQNPDRIVVHLAFDRPETMELFRRHADQLTEAIRLAGYAEARLDFGQAGAGSGDGARPGWAGGNGEGAGPPQTSADQRTATDAEPVSSYVLRLSGIAGMDLRL